MASGVGLIKVIAVLGFIVILTASITGQTPTEWDAIGVSIRTGITFPEFWNPFTQAQTTFSAYMDGPVIINDTYDQMNVTWVGCADDPFNRSKCLATEDEEESYMLVNWSGTSFLFARLQYNYSNPMFLNILGPTLREVTVTIQCRTISNGTAAMPIYVGYGHGGSAGDASSFCPTDRLETLQIHNSMPTGWPSPDPPFVSVGYGQGDMGFDLVAATQNGSLDAYPAIGLFTFFRIDITLATGDECAPGPGAWFPFLDEIACAIIGFANFVWKGIQFVVSGVAWVILSLASVIGFVGGIIVNLFLGTIAVYGVLFNLGAPSPVQEIIDIFAVVAIAFVVYVIISLMRGTEG